MFLTKVGGLDPDAEAFLIATGISDPTITSAINTLVIDLKGYGIWSKLLAIYPLVGGTAFTHKFNLKKPLDTDAAFRVVFNGGWTHSTNGAEPNGTTGYADTKFNAFSNLVFSNASLTYYSNTNTVQTSNIEIGAINVALPNTELLSLSLPRNTGNNAFVCTGQTNVSDLALGTGLFTSLGFFIGSRVSSSVTDCKIYHNGILKGSSTTNTGIYQIPNRNIFFGALNNGGTPNYFSNKRVAFSSIGLGLTNTEVSDLYTIVQAFQTTLGRQV